MELYILFRLLFMYGVGFTLILGVIYSVRRCSELVSEATGGSCALTKFHTYTICA